MPAWSFRPRFREPLLNGLAQIAGARLPYPRAPVKRQTIRARRVDGRDPTPGLPMRLWIAQRTSRRELLGETPPISERWEIRVAKKTETIRIDGTMISGEGVARLARADGFRGWAELLAFLERDHGFPFRGFVYRW